MTYPTSSAAHIHALAHANAFIETQFPVSKLSKESYKERKAGASQTITGLGKWWGRKPLVLVRAVILGLLLPSTADPTKDRETFLALMTMDDDGLNRRRKGTIPAGVVYQHATDPEKERYFAVTAGKASWRRGLPATERAWAQELAFRRMGYDEKLKYCVRPEEIDGPSTQQWERINAHLGTSATGLPELVQELGERRFGHIPRVGDVFCGGGSVPFEAARIGCDAYGSDLNPIAGLLTWSALNVVGGGVPAVKRVQTAQKRVYEAVQTQIETWGIETSEEGWVAEAFLYCNEATDPTTGWRVPLAPTWVIAEGAGVAAKLVPVPETKSFDFEIRVGATAEELSIAKADGTWAGGVRCPVDEHGNHLPPSRRQTVSTRQIRGAGGIRHWEASDILPRPGDMFQERLYCIRYFDPATHTHHFRAPNTNDLARESKVISLVAERLSDWQEQGYLPDTPIEAGVKTSDLTQMRGWTYWHHVYNPRQLLINGLIMQTANEFATDSLECAALLLVSARLADWNSRLCRWNTSARKTSIGAGEQTYYEQSLAPLANYVCRGLTMLSPFICTEVAAHGLSGTGLVTLVDARSVSTAVDCWITDPGYADAVRYEELSELFLAWVGARLPAIFTGWHADSKRALAVSGRDEDFRRAMVECYRKTTELMADPGYQVVMFTHQDADVWSDLAMILWASGLQVVSAWTIGTETGGVVQNTNQVQGTVLLVLRKREGNPRGDLADIFPDVQAEVRSQLAQMLTLDDKEDPNFGDSDYQLAAYAAALRVLTAYAAVDEIDVEREIYRTRSRGERSPLTGLIEKAVRIASDFLVPDGLDALVWRKVGPDERLYLKGVEVESHGEHREGVYQEFARGYGVGEYRDLLQSGAANQTRLKSPSEFKDARREPTGGGFPGSLLRQVLFAIYVTAREDNPRPARDYLADVLTPMAYWDNRQTILALLKYLADRPSVSMPHWYKDVEAARLLFGFIQNDSV